MKKIIILTLCASVTAFSAALSGGISKVGTTSASFLKNPVGARALAMGGAYSSIANDATAAYWNPAMLGLITNFSADVSHSKLLAELNTNYFGAAFAMGSLGTGAISVLTLGMDEMDVTTEQYQDGTGEIFNAGSYAVTFSYGKFITDRFAIGGSARYVNEYIWNSESQAFAFDIGSYFVTPFWDTKFSAVVFNYGSKMQMTGEDLLTYVSNNSGKNGANDRIEAIVKTDKFEMPIILRTGISNDFKITDYTKILLAADAVYSNDNTPGVNLGTELAFWGDLIKLRGGLRNLFQDNRTDTFSLGMGLSYDAFESVPISIDYAYMEHKYLDAVQMFSFGVKF